MIAGRSISDSTAISTIRIQFERCQLGFFLSYYAPYKTALECVFNIDAYKAGYCFL